jgi:WD40 repeat protein
MNWFKFSFSLLTLLLFSSLLRAGDPPVEPILRIEPGNHISDIRSISSDGGGRWLVTASLDKTAKVWNLNDGTLSITLRPPSGELLEGQLSAIAISPDGKIVVVGGWTQFSNGSTTVVSEGMSIYFFDRASGRLINRVSGMANTVVTLRFTPDGRFFIATLGGREGIRIFNASSGALVAGDSNYGDSSYSADFRQDKSDEFRLVTTSSDGFLRLYRFDGSKLT